MSESVALSFKLLDCWSFQEKFFSVHSFSSLITVLIFNSNRLHGGILVVFWVILDSDWCLIRISMYNLSFIIWSDSFVVIYDFKILHKFELKNAVTGVLNLSLFNRFIPLFAVLDIYPLPDLSKLVSFVDLLNFLLLASIFTALSVFRENRGSFHY